MRFETFRGYFLAIIAGLVLVAEAVLIIVNSKNTGTFHLYIETRTEFNIALLMLLSACGGVLAVLMFRVLIRGIRILRSGRRKETLDRLVAQQKAPAETQPQSPPAPEANPATPEDKQGA